MYKHNIFTWEKIHDNYNIIETSGLIDFNRIYINKHEYMINAYNSLPKNWYFFIQPYIKNGLMNIITWIKSRASFPTYFLLEPMFHKW